MELKKPVNSDRIFISGMTDDGVVLYQWSVRSKKVIKVNLLGESGFISALTTTIDKRNLFTGSDSGV